MQQSPTVTKQKSVKTRTKDTGTQESWDKFFSEYNSPKSLIPVLLKYSKMKAWQMFIVPRESISQSLSYSYIVEMYYSDKTNSNSLPHKDYEAFDAFRGLLRLDVGTAESFVYSCPPRTMDFSAEGILLPSYARRTASTTGHPLILKRHLNIFYHFQRLLDKMVACPVIRGGMHKKMRKQQKLCI